MSESEFVCAFASIKWAWRRGVVATWHRVCAACEECEFSASQRDSQRDHTRLFSFRILTSHHPTSTSTSALSFFVFLSLLALPGFVHPNTTGSENFFIHLPDLTSLSYIFNMHLKKPKYCHFWIIWINNSIPIPTHWQL